MYDGAVGCGRVSAPGLGWHGQPCEPKIFDSRLTPGWRGVPAARKRKVVRGERLSHTTRTSCETRRDRISATPRRDSYSRRFAAEHYAQGNSTKTLTIIARFSVLSMFMTRVLSLIAQAL